jgi:hypothetical protein
MAPSVFWKMKSRFATVYPIFMAKNVNFSTTSVYWAAKIQDAIMAEPVSTGSMNTLAVVRHFLMAQIASVT